MINKIKAEIESLGNPQSANGLGYLEALNLCLKLAEQTRDKIFEYEWCCDCDNDITDCNCLNPNYVIHSNRVKEAFEGSEVGE